MARSNDATTNTDDTPGIRPDKVRVTCANCDAGIARLSSATMQDVPLSCDECPSGGTVVKNRYGYVKGVYGALEIHNMAESDDVDAEA